MTKWWDIIKEQIDFIAFAEYWNGTSKDLGYGETMGQGVTKDILWQGQRILKAGNPVRSMCVGAVAEVLFKSLKAGGMEQQISVGEIQLIQEHLWITDEFDQYDGVAGALIDADYADRIGDPKDAQPGDFCQIWDWEGAYTVFGHAFIITGQTENQNGDPAVACWSSDNYANHGHGYDYFSWTHPDPKKEREFFIARLKDSLYRKSI